MWSRLLALALTCALLLPPAPALAGVKEKIAGMAPSGIVLVVDEKGNELIAQNADRPFAPASVTKIVTAWLAMQVLGGDYRFETKFYLDKNRVLYVRGGGDPFLVSEELAELGNELVAAIGKEPLTGIVLDASYYPPDIRIPGIENTTESYDALNSALAVNFNTIAAVRKGIRVRSAESQTPITPIAIREFKARGPNGRGRISLSKDPAVSLQYAGELIAAFIEKAGGSVNGKITTGTVPEGLKPVYVHKSRPLSQILVQLLIASNNYIANQVFLEIGGTLGGSVSLEKSLKVANAMLAANGLDKDISHRGGLRHQPRQPFHGPRPRQGARPFRAARQPASRPRRRLEQDRHHVWHQHARGLRRHQKPRPRALRDRAQDQWPAALRSAPRHRGWAVGEARFIASPRDRARACQRAFMRATGLRPT